jgi:hypothetical protein
MITLSTRLFSHWSIPLTLLIILRLLFKTQVNLDSRKAQIGRKNLLIPFQRRCC